MSADCKSDAPVLIGGGGPTGLIAAGELLRRGVRCRLIDRLPVPHQTSKSFTIHSRTMEMMEHIGIAHRYLDTGIKSNGRSEEHTSELQSLMRNSYAVFCLKKKQIKRRPP